MKRIVEPELLDHLPPGDSDARHSRNDLLRLNAWMGNAAILARQLQTIAREQKPRRLLDLGTGDARLIWQAAQKLPRDWKGTCLDLLDKHGSISNQARRGLKDLGWQVRDLRADASQFLMNTPREPWSATCANLFLHHWSDRELASLLALVSQRTAVFIAVEPRRSFWSLIASRMIGFIGCNRVTRHDAVVSVRAGFADHGLSELWPKEDCWCLQERPVGLFSHLFVARKMSLSIGARPRRGLNPIPA